MVAIFSGRNGLITAVVVLGMAGALLPASQLLAITTPDSVASAKPAAKADKAASADDAAQVAKGHALFSDAGCSACHTLAAAGAGGEMGPSLDGDPHLTKAFIVNRVTNGQGAMPPFGGQLSAAEIADIAAYVTQVAAK